MADIKIPGVGPVDKKKALAIGAAVAAAIVVVVIRRKSAASAAAATPAATDTTGIDPATGIPYADEQSSNDLVDPATGVPYADEQNGLTSFDTGSGDSALSSSNFDAAGYPIGSEADLAWQAQQDGTSVSGSNPTTAITSNSQWLAAAEAQLGDTSAITQALTKVLGGVAVTSAQQQIFMEAVGIIGQPPGGYPTINLTSTPAQPTPTAPGGGTVTVPNVKGMSANNGLAALSRVGLVGHLNVTRNPKDTYTIKGQTPGGGAKAAKGSTVDLDISTP
jgi:PASTA domain-containing protein